MLDLKICLHFLIKRFLDVIFDFFSREQQDKYGMDSYRKAAAAYANGHIKVIQFSYL
jgi:hypothetical protein